jgi:hypothetical protein
MQLSTSLARSFAQTYSIPLRFPFAHSDCELSTKWADEARLGLLRSALMGGWSATIHDAAVFGSAVALTLA